MRLRGVSGRPSSPSQNLRPLRRSKSSSVPTPDAWLERRLRVFERALTALETRAEATARDHARVIAQLEEQLTALGGGQAERRLASRPVDAGAG